MTADRLDSIDQRLAALVAVAEDQQASITLLTANVTVLNHTTELLVDGMGQLLEGMTEIRVASQQQAQNIDRLTRIVEQLLGQQNQ